MFPSLTQFLWGDQSSPSDTVNLNLHHSLTALDMIIQQSLIRQLLDHEASHSLLVAQYSSQCDALHKLLSQVIGLSDIDLRAQILQLQDDNDALLQERITILKDKFYMLHGGMKEKIDALTMEVNSLKKEKDALLLVCTTSSRARDPHSIPDSWQKNFTRTLLCPSRMILSMKRLTLQQRGMSLTRKEMRSDSIGSEC